MTKMKWLMRSQVFIQSIETYLVMLLFAAILIINVVQPLDGDTWWHLRAGQITLAQQRPLVIDVFSYTKFGESWASHEWLSELWMFIFFRVAGFAGLSVWISLLGMTTAILLYRLMEGPKVYRAVLTVLAVLLLTPFLKARPQMVTMVCILLVALILDHYRRKPDQWLFLLIPLFLIWANLHGGFVIGFLYAILYIAGDAMDRFWYGNEEQSLTKMLRLKLCLVLLICGLIVLVHPLGVGVWTTMLNTLNTSAGSEYITEWASPNFHAPGQQLYLWVVLGILTVLSLVHKKVQWKDMILLVFFIASGFIWQRQLSFLAIFGMAIISRYLYDVIISGLKKIKRLVRAWARWTAQIRPVLTQSTPLLIRILFLLVVALLYSVALVKTYLLTTESQIQRVEWDLFPHSAMVWILENQPAGRMMNSYNWGGYFDWYLREYPVFIDSRADLFRGQIITQWLDVMNANEDWHAILDLWQVNFIIIEPGWPIVKVLPYTGWEESYRDSQSVIFTRVIPTKQ